jgi:hypothetical protein
MSDVWTENEKHEIVASYRQGNGHPPCPNDDEAVDVDEQGYLGGEVKVGFSCPACGARAEWHKKSGAVI